MIDKMKMEQYNLKSLVEKMSSETNEKLEKLKYFEMKLNKWIKEFQMEQEENTNSFNELLKKTNDNQSYMHKTFKQVQNELTKISKTAGKVTGPIGSMKKGTSRKPSVVPSEAKRVNSNRSSKNNKPSSGDDKSRSATIEDKS